MSGSEARISRAQIEATIAATRDATNRGDWDAFVDCFAEGGRFMNSALPTPLEGREVIRSFTKIWPRVINIEEWRAIDAGRFVIGWNERHYDSPPDDIYRGISTFLFDADGQIVDYEGIFDPAKVAAAYERVASVV